MARANDAGPYDAVVVMGKRPVPGQPPGELAARAACAVLAWRTAGQPLMPLICVEGYDIAGYPESGAGIVAGVARRAGVPDACLVAPALSNCTAREVEGLRDVLAARGCRRPLVITHPYHVSRTRWYLRGVGIAPVMRGCRAAAASDAEPPLRDLLVRGEPGLAQLAREHVIEGILSAIHLVDRGGRFERWLADRVRGRG